MTSIINDNMFYFTFRKTNIFIIKYKVRGKDPLEEVKCKVRI